VNCNTIVNVVEFYLGTYRQSGEDIAGGVHFEKIKSVHGRIHCDFC
jgi:hypothetical protein